MRDVNGPWEVTTEGDEEGLTINHLGIYSGPVDRIAFGLADRAYNTLQFRLADVEDAAHLPITKTEAYVVVVAENGYETVNTSLFKDCPVTVEGGPFFASLKLTAQGSYLEERRRVLAKQARNKLSDEEYEALLLAQKEVGE